MSPPPPTGDNTNTNHIPSLSASPHRAPKQQTRTAQPIPDVRASPGLDAMDGDHVSKGDLTAVSSGAVSTSVAFPSALRTTCPT